MPLLVATGLAMATPLPAVGTSAAVAEGPGFVYDLGVGGAPRSDGFAVAPRLSLGGLVGPRDDALLVGLVASAAAPVDAPEQGTAELRLSGAVGSPARTTWVGFELAGGAVLGASPRLRTTAVGTLTADLDPLTTVTLRMGALHDEVLVPTLGLGFVYRPAPKAHAAFGVDAVRGEGEGWARYPVAGVVTFGGRVGPDVVTPAAPDAFAELAPASAEERVDVREHPMLTCPGDSLPTGNPPPLGREAWCVRVVDDRLVHDGPWVRWHDPESVAEVGHFTLGRRSGAWSAYDPDGTLREAGLFEADLEQGLWTTYYADGTVEERATYVDGELHGPWELFAPEGHVEVVGVYADGLRTGVWLDLDAAGVPTRERRYEAGRLVQQRELEPVEAP